MRKRTWIAGAVVAALALAVFAGSSVASAQEDHSGAVKARTAYMQLNGFFMGQLAAVAKGQVPYDAAQATGIAKSLLALSTMDAGTMWPPGSGNDNPALAGKTRAKPELWTTFPAVMEKANALTAALEAMVVAAGTDLASLQGAFGQVGAGCGGCHRSFRAEKF
jgi:cytochrome c556